MSVTLPRLRLYADALWVRAWYRGEGSMEDLKGIVDALDELAAIKAGLVSDKEREHIPTAADAL